MQFSNALSPIEVTLLSKRTVVKLLQPLKAYDLIVVTSDGMVISFAATPFIYNVAPLHIGFEESPANLILHHADKSSMYRFLVPEKLEKAELLISFTLPGMVILASLLQLKKVSASIVVIPFGIVMLVSAVQ
jgi:hypothetical protein